MAKKKPGAFFWKLTIGTPFGRRRWQRKSFLSATFELTMRFLSDGLDGNMLDVQPLLHVHVTTYFAMNSTS